MSDFENLYLKTIVLTEMARPNKLIPSLIGPNLFNRYEELIKKVNYCMKYGKDLNGNTLIDIDGNVAEGLGDDILQDRRYRYFFFYLNKFNETINPKSKTYELDYIKADVSAHNYLKEILTDKGIWNIPTPTKVLTGNAFSILKNKKYFLSPEFENLLLNPTNIATHMNYLRVKNDGLRTSLSAAKKKEQAFDIGIYDVHGALARTRDDRTKINKRNAYDSRKSRTRSLPNS